MTASDLPDRGTQQSVADRPGWGWRRCTPQLLGETGAGCGEMQRRPATDDQGHEHLVFVGESQRAEADRPEAADDNPCKYAPPPGYGGRSTNDPHPDANRMSTRLRDLPELLERFALNADEAAEQYTGAGTVAIVAMRGHYLGESAGLRKAAAHLRAVLAAQEASR